MQKFAFEPLRRAHKRGRALDLKREPALSFAISCLGSRTPSLQFLCHTRKTQPSALKLGGYFMCHRAYNFDVIHFVNKRYLCVLYENLLSSSLLSKKLKIKIYRTIILPLFCMGVKLGR